MDKDSAWLKAPIRALAEQERRRRAQRPNLEEELLDYHFGTLPPEKIEEIEDHLAHSAEATAAVLDMASFPDVESRVAGFDLSDEDVAAEWRRMEQLLATTTAHEAPAPSAPEPPLRFFASRTFSFAMAAVLLLAVVGLSAWVGMQHRRINQLSAPHFDVYLADLVPLAPEASERGGEPENVVRVPPWSERVLLVLNLAEQPAATEYLVEVSNAAGVEIWSSEGTGSRSDGSFILDLPSRFLPAGRYQLRLLDRTGDERPLLALYSFEIEYD